MKNRRLARIALPAALASIVLAGCFDDPVRTPKESQQTPTQEYREPTSKENVLFNLVLAYDNMDIDHYAEVLDPTDFIFTFKFPKEQTDVPVAWNFDQERAAAAYMFAGGGGFRSAPVRNVDVLFLNLESVAWVDVDPGDAYPGETWVQGEVQYKFTIDAERDIHWISAGKPRAQLTMRPRDVDGTTEWKIVRWGDVPDLPEPLSGLAAAPDGVEDVTWSLLKFIYSGDPE